MEARLDSVIARYVAPLAERYGFVPVRREVFAMGALQHYVAGELHIRIVNDRGIVAFEVGPRGHPELTREVALIKEHLEPPRKGVLNLSLAEQAAFLDENWLWLNEAFSQARYRATLEALARHGRRAREGVSGRQLP